MKKLLCLLLVLCLPLQALAETTDDAQASPEPSATAAPSPSPMPTLPTDFSAAPAAKGRWTENVYFDDSLYVWLETIERDESLYYVAHITVVDASQLRTAVADGAQETVASLAQRVNAVVAVNGDNYRRNRFGWAIRQGTTLRDTKQPDYDMLLIDTAGDFHAVRLPSQASIAAAFSAHDVVDCFACGPVLVMDRMPQHVYRSVGGSRKYLSRTAIGQIGPLNYVLVVVDGGQPDSRGVTHKQLRSFMYDLGCRTAFSLDEGANSAMWFGGKLVNQPAQEMTVDDILYFGSLLP